ncbi:MAG: N-acetylmuramoyl-L-alanine amidase [Luteolibacter sp.]
MSLCTKALAFLVLLILAAGGWLAFHQPERPLVLPTSDQPKTATIPASPPGETTTPEPDRHLGPLGDTPDWSALDAYQGTISRREFEQLLDTIFTTGSQWRNYFSIGDKEAVIATDTRESGLRFHLRFATPEGSSPAPRHWRTARELPPAPPERPLEGLRIAIDPGHIGGTWAKMEERWFVIGEAPPVCEGDLTLAVARLLKPELESLGATVTLVRNNSEPLTPLRPETLMTAAEATTDSGGDVRKTAERLFYRTAEIRARAEYVNRSLKPDLVLCLHFNAEAWGNALNPTLTDHSHCHLLLNGGYTDDELALSDQRFEMLRKLLQRTHAEEAAIGADVAASFYSSTGLPPYTYNPASRNARMVDGNPYLWARNLLANRLYDCPVIFMEPYVMNSRHDYNRIQAGDYEGTREIDGKQLPSIFREYAGAVANGLKTHYAKIRQGEPLLPKN